MKQKPSSNFFLDEIEILWTLAQLSLILLGFYMGRFKKFYEFEYKLVNDELVSMISEFISRF